jgi:hypothetical protein
MFDTEKTHSDFENQSNHTYALDESFDSKEYQDKGNTLIEDRLKTCQAVRI